MGAGLPYNSIEALVLGNLTNTGTQPLNLKGSWIIVPYSMGVQTQFEGVWKRQTQPNSYFKVYCWCGPALALRSPSLDCLVPQRAGAWVRCGAAVVELARAHASSTG